MEIELSHQIYPRIKASFIALLFLMLVVLFILVSGKAHTIGYPFILNMEGPHHRLPTNCMKGSHHRLP
jgi:hypothetical protein